MWGGQRFFVFALMLSTCSCLLPIKTPKKIDGKTYNKTWFREFGDDSDLIEICRKNAAKGEKADPAITALCKNVPGFLPKPNCPPLPPRPKPIDDHKVPLADRLNSGMIQMWSGLQNSINGIFILGNTGSGKSTLAQILTSNLSRLYATELTVGGTMVIFDEDDRIGAPTTVSRTIIPEFVVSSETNAGFWDCPGFDDTRGPDVDIASMYFLKTALDNVQQAKFLFTVTASSMKPGNDRLDFDLLATHTTHLIQNLEQVANAIGLVVTKVPNYSESGIYKTDEMIMSEFINFLETYVVTTKEKLDTTDKTSEKKFLARKLKFAEFLLGGKKTASKIAFVRTPDICGSLDKIPSISKSRTMVTKLYQEQMEYSSVSPFYFQVSLKTETILNLETEIVPQTVARVKQEVVQSATNVWQQFRHSFDNLVQKGDTQQILQILFDVGAKFKLHNSSTSDFADKLEQIFKVFTTDQNETSITLIAEMEKQLRFFEFVSEKEISIPDGSWTEPLQTLGKNITELLEFYKFCQKLDAELGTYTKQVILTSLLKSDTKANITANGTLEFLIGNNLVRVPSQVEILWQSKLLSIDKEFLAKLVRDQVPVTKLVCTKSAQFKDKYHLQVSGKNVKLSDFLADLQTRWPGSCSSPDKLKEISVLGRDNVFLDQDFSGNCSTIHLSLLAPNWEVIGTNRTIFLGCLSYKYEVPDAPSGSNYGDWGSSGRNGRPGINAGSCFGVYNKLVNGASLNIVANGGNGERGQNGGAGAAGKPGRNARYADFPSAWDLAVDKLKIVEYGYMDKNGNLVTKGHCIIALAYNKCWFTKPGGWGGYGGNGGLGGNGGPPGNSGNVLLFNLENKSEVASQLGILTQQGIPGQPGQGGHFGNGGRGGKHYSCRCSSIPPYIPWWDMCYSTPNHDWGMSGLMGKNGQINSIPVPQEKAELWPVINLYKSLFFEPKLQSKFIERMEKSSKIMGLLKPRAFAEELETVEERYFKAASREKPKFAEAYNQFLDRIVAYAKAENGSISTEDRIVLNFVYTAALGKIATVKGNMNTVKVTNTLDYFNTLSGEARILTSKQRDVAIVEETGNYERILTEKINEAQGFIENLALPALDKVEMLEQQAESELVLEVNEYLKAAEQNLEKQQKIMRDFENSLPLRGILSGLKFVGTICTLFGPEGKIIGTAIEAGSIVADSLLLKPVPDVPEFELPIAFTTRVKELTGNLLEEKLEIVEKQVNLTMEAALNCGGDLDDLKQKAEGVKVELETIRSNARIGNYSEGTAENLRKLDQLSQNLKCEVHNVGENGGQTGSNQTEPDAKKEKRKKAAKKLGIALGLLSAGMHFFQEIGAESSELEKLQKLVEKAEQQVKMVEAKKLALYENLLPNLEKISNDILQMSQKAADKNLVALSVQRWNLQNLVKTMSRDLEEFTKGMPVQEKFQLAMDQMEQAVNLVVTLYEHVERYKEKKQMAGFIANINLAQDQRSQIKDSGLKKLLAEMDFAITANLFVEDYQKAMTAFKQWAFPFAENYLDKREQLVDNFYTLRGFPDGEKAMQEIVQTFKSKVERLSIQLGKYYDTTVSGDENIIVTKFVGGKISSRPFFVWGNSQWNQSLQRLLQGQVVHLKADPEMDLGTKRMLEGKGAVKYKSVESHFTADDPKLQKELDEAMKHFAVEMKHSGVSAYELAGKKYEITDASQTYRYCFEQEENLKLAGTMCKNQVMNKTGDYLMSPYTWWKFQLINVDPDHGLSFEDLERRFGGKVNFELVGDGVYLDVKRAGKEFVEKLDLDSFYEPFNINDEYWGMSKDKW